MRAVHLRTPSAVSKVNGIPMHSSHRQGNCMKRSLGKKFHRGLEMENMSTAHTAAQVTSEYHNTGLRIRQLRDIQAALIVSRISASATHEISRLKASWSASVV